ncbi:hypothetical protein G6F22_015665 [Rhizopus arrhizus]|nr:hypothetical protein G6F22_015665 [Rhizopus arrhizus]
MAHLLAGLPDDYLREMAAYFSEQHVPYPAPTRAQVSSATMEAGRTLALNGDAARGLPACASCHGAALSGLMPAIPGLLGLPRDYIGSQIGSWKNGLRRAAAPDCMADIADKLTPTDIGALAAWLSSQPVVEPYAPEAAGSLRLPAEILGVVLLAAVVTAGSLYWLGTRDDTSTGPAAASAAPAAAEGALPAGWQRVAGAEMPAVHDQKAVLPAKVHSDDGADIEVADTSRIIAGGDDVIAVIEVLGLGKQVFAAPTNTTTQAGLAAPHQFLFNRTTGVEGVLSLQGSLFLGKIGRARV